MIYEHARITIHDGQASEFEEAFRNTGATALLAAEGCRGASLHRSAETANVYLLRVKWDSVDDHLTRFPGTPEAAKLEESIAHYFTGPPTVEHFEAENA
jgi:heme-degrading monooxygenase HmoA